MTDNENYIRIANLAKEYKGKNPIIVFNNFNINIKKGDIHCIFGPNGCGKSTLLNIISGIDNDYHGEVYLKEDKPKPGRVGFLFQDYKTALFPWLSCMDNITFKYILNGTKIEKREIIANKLLEKLGINLNLKKYPYEYSGGQQQLIALSRALCDSPDILLMDEPFSALDANMRENIRRQTIEILQVLKITVIIVSHNLEDCVYCADNISFLSNIPTNVIKTMEIPLDKTKNNRNIYSNEFAGVLDTYKEFVKNDR